MVGNWRRILLGCLLLTFVTTIGWSAQAEWRDSGYDFITPHFVLVTEPNFRYEGYDVGDRNKFVRYPYAEEKIRDMLNGKLQGSTRHRFVDMNYVIKQIQADAAITEPLDPKSPNYSAIVQRELGKHVDLVLELEVRDYGWFYEWHDAYRTTETYKERIYYKRKNADGKEVEGWTEVPRTRVVYHKAGYFIFDSAAVSFCLHDPKTGRDVWKFSDTRSRRSIKMSEGYDPNGPESMMNRIFNEAFRKNPLMQSN